MDKLTFTSGMTISSNDVSKSWGKIVQSVQNTHKPIWVYKNDMPEAVILSFDEFQRMLRIIENVDREQLGLQMVSDLAEIAQLSDQPIRHMVLNEKGFFEEAEKK